MGDLKSGDQMGSGPNASQPKYDSGLLYCTPKWNHVSQSDHYCCTEQFLEIYQLTNHLLTMLISFQLTSPILLKYSKKQFSTKPPEETKGLDGGRCSKAWEKL